MELLKFKDYTVYYKLKRGKYLVALNKLNFGVDSGDFVAVVGESGCGKTTLVKSLLGSNKLVEGDIFIDGKNSDGLNLAKQNFAYVAQDYNLYPSMTVYENIAYPLKLMRTDSAEIDKRVKAIADKLEISFLLSRKPKQLSGGQHQRVSIARALVKNPSLILFDEPFANLEPELRQKLRELVKTAHEQYRNTVIFVTHDLNEAVFLADKILVLDNGSIVEYGRKADVLKAPKSKLMRMFVCA